MSKTMPELQQKLSRKKTNYNNEVKRKKERTAEN